MNEQFRTDEMLVAPHEVRELLTRLTESRIESIPAQEARTLEGLALDTGIPVARLRQALDEIRGVKPTSHTPLIVGGLVAIALAVIAVFFLSGSPPATVAPTGAVAIAPSYDTEGLVALSQVRFGPNAGSLRVDPSFHPALSLPKGVAISATIGPLIWGAGDPYATRSANLTPAEIANVKKSLGDLVRHSLKRAQSRHLAIGAGGGEPGLTALGPGYAVGLAIELPKGRTLVDLKLPAPGQGDPADAAAITDRAVDLLLQRLARLPSPGGVGF